MKTSGVVCFSLRNTFASQVDQIVIGFGAARAFSTSSYFMPDTPLAERSVSKEDMRDARDHLVDALQEHRTPKLKITAEELEKISYYAQHATHILEEMASQITEFLDSTNTDPHNLSKGTCEAKVHAHALLLGIANATAFKSNSVNFSLEIQSTLQDYIAQGLLNPMLPVEYLASFKNLHTFPKSLNLNKPTPSEPEPSDESPIDHYSGGRTYAHRYYSTSAAAAATQIANSDPKSIASQGYAFLTQYFTLEAISVYGPVVDLECDVLVKNGKNLLHAMQYLPDQGSDSVDSASARQVISANLQFIIDELEQFGKSQPGFKALEDIQKQFNEAVEKGNLLPVSDSNLASAIQGYYLHAKIDSKT